MIEKMTQPTIAAIVLTKNEAGMIANCLETLRWCSEILVIDHNSTDTTTEIASRQGAKVVKAEGSFAHRRNEALKRCKADWLLYIDADERVTPDLAQEIMHAVTDGTDTAYAICRSNILYGRVFEHGGWQDDWVVRLFKREKLQKWAGEVHEHAEVEGKTGRLRSLLVHLTHRDVVSSLQKSVEWTPIEARLLFEAGAPKVTARTLFRKTTMELFRRVVRKGAYQDGMAGWVEAWTQAMNRLLVYMQLWQLQQKPSLPERYQRFEHSIAELWKHQS